MKKWIYQLMNLMEKLFMVKDENKKVKIDFSFNKIFNFISILVPISKGHVDTLAPTVEELVELEKRVQTSFFALRNCRNIIATS